MIDTIAIDMDGPLTPIPSLFSIKDLHWRCLNRALSDIDKKYIIDYESHLREFDGLTTSLKLNKLSKERGLPLELHKEIWNKKQKYTEQELKNNIKKDDDLEKTLGILKEKGYKLLCCTNSIKSTTQTILKSLGIIQYFDCILTNEDVCQAKPHPNIYLKAMVESCSTPDSTLIIEDSISGSKSAFSSGAHVLIVKDRSETTLENIMNKINEVENKKENKKFPFKGNIVIPMCGLSQRFTDAGYIFPKYMLDVIGHQSMIEMVVNSLGIEGNFIYLVRKEHVDKFNLKQMLNLITPNCKIIEVNENTCGAACTILKAEELINNDKPLIVCNCDQYVEFDFNEFAYLMNNSNVSGGILTFETKHPRWSFAKLDKDGFVEKVAEKNPISNLGTCGIYYYKRGNEFIKYTKQMIKKELKVNGEYYVCPVFNEYIEDGKKIKTYNVKTMIGCGIPEDYLELKRILNNKKS